MWSWETRGTVIFGALACQLHITANFTLRARQKAVREGCSNAAAIEIEHTALMLTREHNPPQESIASLATDKSKAQQKIKRVPTRRQMPAQTASRCITNPQVTNELRVMEPPLMEVVQGLLVPEQLVLVER